MDVEHSHEDEEVQRLIRRSDELVHRSNEIISTKSLTAERIEDLRMLSDELLRNCERILNVLHGDR